jgi:hypothetical protein
MVGGVVGSAVAVSGLFYATTLPQLVVSFTLVQLFMTAAGERTREPLLRKHANTHARKHRHVRTHVRGGLSKLVSPRRLYHCLCSGPIQRSGSRPGSLVAARNGQVW